MEGNLIWGMSPQVAAIVIVAVSYIIIFSEKVNRAVVALIGAAVMIISGILNQAEAVSGIDFNTLALLVGMMMIVAVSESRVFFSLWRFGLPKRLRPARGGCWLRWLWSQRCFPGFWIMLQRFC